MLTAYLEQLAALHRHLCPRQVLGVRMGRLAAARLALDLPQADKRLVTFVETDGCFADGVAVATGCWFGRRTLRLVDEGKIAATFVDPLAERAVRVWPHPLARQRATDYAPGAADHWQAMLAGYQVMPDELLLLARPVALTVSLAALLGQPGRRVSCAGCGEEIINGREVWRAGRPWCQSCDGATYYRPTPAGGMDTGALAGAGGAADGQGGSYA